ncbi:autotransporter outer membrane beta-barrel domain-containing protein [Novosphingobium sp. KCTC 2891]|uniref:autotransporter outer membrane beta-barrel domain-containing protein n=1 Tax=Novosphingobium sp. KCTC 2891 TaxID=2989730 RepID=UPI002221D245|nr:autotransporter outer membrane beta-barrel domain-containing protein [Novosphingobium sp. KCTC 2891]MCW1383126.1 autotransporter outer membrane beta-barrel domain-containing protein [Novosphingobium sp. KCTC 2891]
MPRHAANRFLASTATFALIPVALAAGAAPALADTTISTSTTAPLATSSAGNVTVASGGTVAVTTGNAVTVDAGKTVTVNSGGAITAGTGNGAMGIFVAPVATTITNDGTITVTETFTAADADSNGIADGPVASASDRYGIHVASGGTMTGSIGNTGTIAVDGLNSAGIAVDSALTGDLTTTGTIKVKGDNSVGIRTGAVAGSVNAGGSVSVIGQGAQALVVSGDVGGKVKINGALTQAASYTADDGTTQVLSRSALHSGKAAVQIGGNVAGGVVLYAPVDSSATDQSTGSIIAFGNSPALLIGGAADTTIGGGTTKLGTYSLGIDGSVSATSYYSSTDAYGVVIGGQGGNVTLTNGIGVSGSITATTIDSSATALLINAGSSVTTLSNDGTIKAVISSPGIGGSYAIKDMSGTLATISNTGTIAVSGSSEDKLAAIDVSANTTGVTIKQSLNATNAALQATAKAASGYNPDTATVYTSITGDIYTGSGNDTLDVGSGKITGNTYLAAGDDTVKLADDAKYIGKIDFGTGTAAMTMAGNSRFTGTMALNGQLGTLTLADSARWLGTVTGGSQLTVNVNSGTFGANATGTTAVHALNIGAGGTLAVYVDGATGTSSKLVADTASFASGAKISATVSSLAEAEGTYTVLSAGTLTGTGNIGDTALNMPVLYNGTVSAEGNDLLLTISRKTADQLGLNAAQASAYGAILANAVNYASLQTSLLQVADVATLQSQFSQLLPVFNGGTFDLVTRGSRLAARHVADDSSIFTISDVGGWLEPIYFRGTEKADATGAGFKTDGYGLSFGMERRTGIGNIGASFLYFSGNAKTGDAQTVKGNSYELGAFWRLAKGPLYAYARAGVGKTSFTSTRTFAGTADSTAFTYTAAGSWKGWTVSGTGGLSYKVDVGGGFSLKPKAVLDYYRLHENGYTETGDAALALAVGSRNSSALNGTTTLVAAWSAGQGSYEGRPFTVELEAGRRNRLSGELGDVTANFTGGNAFTLTPESIRSAWVGEASILQGGLDYTWKLSAGAERTQGGGTSYSARASLSIAL